MFSDRENRLVVAKVKGAGGGTDWEFEINRGKLLYIECINNKVLLYSTGNYIQYPVVNHNGKDYEKNGLYMCVCMNHLAVQQKFTQHCKSTYLT